MQKNLHEIQPSIQVNEQQALAIIGEVQQLKTVGWDLIRPLKTKLDAVRLMVQLSGCSNEYICEVTGIQPAQFTRMMQGRANVPADARYTKLLVLCNNSAVIQWEAMQFGLGIVSAKDQQIAELKQELERLQA